MAALLAVLCCVTVVPSRAMNYVVEIPPDRMDGTGLLYAHLVDTNPIWDPRTLWSSVYVTVNCSVSGVCDLHWTQSVGAYIRQLQACKHAVVQLETLAHAGTPQETVLAHTGHMLAGWCDQRHTEAHKPQP